MEQPKIDIQELVETLREDQLTELLVTVAEELVQLSGAWCEKAKVETDAGHDEFEQVFEQSHEFYLKAIKITHAAADLEAFSGEIGAFD